MKTYLFPILALLSLAACKDEKEKDSAEDDTGETEDSDSGDSDSTVDSDTQDTELPCETYVIETTPQKGDNDFLYNDTLDVAFSDDATSAIIELSPQGGKPVGIDIAWGKGNLRATITPTEHLQASTAYELHVNICETDLLVPFTTSMYGAPLEIDPSALVGNTYIILLTEARFVQPAGAEALLGLVFNKPLLFGVTQASTKSITFVATEGRTLPTGGYEQVMSSDVWDFPEADFTTTPYFAAVSDDIVFSWQDYLVPVGDFRLDGIFAPDGSSYGGGTVRGLADTRNLSEYYDTGNPAYICEDILATWGIYCQDCGGGDPYCIYIEAENIEAALQPGLTIVD